MITVGLRKNRAGSAGRVFGGGVALTGCFSRVIGCGPMSYKTFQLCYSYETLHNNTKQWLVQQNDAA
jgi:hypothetical protein